jgi:hypothetical protein
VINSVISDISKQTNYDKKLEMRPIAPRKIDKVEEA